MLRQGLLTMEEKLSMKNWNSKRLKSDRHCKIWQYINSLEWLHKKNSGGNVQIVQRRSAIKSRGIFSFPEKV
jgi:hypothetical protein